MTETSFASLSRTQLHSLLNERSVLVLSANQRLQRDCLMRYGRWQSEHGQLLWATPQVLTLDSWLDQCAQTLLFDRRALLQLPNRVLSTRENRQLWIDVIRDLESERPLLRLQESAQLAMNAYTLERRYSLPDQNHESSDEVLRYRIWRREYQKRCRQYGWMNTEDWHWRIWQAQKVQQPVVKQEHIVLLGFDEYSPLLLSLLHQAQAHDIAIMQGCETNQPAVEWQTRASEFADEVNHAVAWAQQQMQQGHRVALVVPDLSTQRDSLERELLKQLHPEAARSPVPLTKGQYNISAGTPLVDQALVRSALCLLQLLGSSRLWSLNDVSYLLRSPYTGDYANDFGLRAHSDARLREAGNDQMAATRVLSYLSPASASDSVPVLPRIYQQWLKARDSRRAWPAKCLPSQWAEHFAALLQEAGWPGTRPFNSVEWQAHKRFIDHLGALAGSDDFIGSCHYNDALRALQDELQDASFQPEANAEAAIQVLGMLEVSGLYFDAIWVLNARDDVLPAPPRPNPFIALALQREHDLPRATCEHEWRYAQQWRTRLRHSTPTLIWSSSEQEGEQIVRVSALLDDIACQPIASFAAKSSPPDPVPLEFRYETEAVPVIDAASLRGGVDLLKAQSRNPLWAFAQFRLGARPLAHLTPFTAPRVHGLIVHAALEAFWREAGDLRTVQAMSHQLRLDKIAVAIQSAFNALMQREHSELPKQWCRLETGLVTQILNECLQWECETRHAFSVVALEQADVWQHRQWQLHTRIDRIDRLPDEREIIIDYKTGNIPSASTLQKRPLQEPQLPLYALIRGEQVHALLFAQLRRGQFKLNGVAQDKDCHAKTVLEEYWPNLRVQWRDELTQLADSLLDGCIENRYQNKSDLQFCPVLPFLRIYAADELASEEETVA